MMNFVNFPLSDYKVNEEGYLLLESSLINTVSMTLFSSLNKFDLELITINLGFGVRSIWYS